MIAHFGLGPMLIGIVATSSWRAERILSMRAGDRIDFAGYEVAFEKLSPREGPNFRETFGSFQLRKKGTRITSLFPSKRQYIAPVTVTTEAAIHAGWAGDFNLVIGKNDQSGPSSIPVGLYFHPLVRLIWIGALVMFLGGVLSLSDRRLWVGAPKQRSISRNMQTARGQA